MTARHILAGVGLLALAIPAFAAGGGMRTAARREGLNLNSFVQKGPVAAHVVLRSGNDPRLIVAFPAGNSGVGLWFAHLPQGAEWSLPTPPLPVSTVDDQGRALHGVRFSATIRARRMTAWASRYQRSAPAAAPLSRRRSSFGPHIASSAGETASVASAEPKSVDVLSSPTSRVPIPSASRYAGSITATKPSPKSRKARAAYTYAAGLAFAACFRAFQPSRSRALPECPRRPLLKIGGP